MMSISLMEQAALAVFNLPVSFVFCDLTSCYCQAERPWQSLVLEHQRLLCITGNGNDKPIGYKIKVWLRYEKYETRFHFD